MKGIENLQFLESGFATGMRELFPEARAHYLYTVDLHYGETIYHHDGCVASQRDIPPNAHDIRFLPDGQQVEEPRTNSRGTFVTKHVSNREMEDHGGHYMGTAGIPVRVFDITERSFWQKLQRAFEYF